MQVKAAFRLIVQKFSSLCLGRDFSSIPNGQKLEVISTPTYGTYIQYVIIYNM